MERLSVMSCDSADKKARITFLMEQVEMLPRAEKGVRYSPELYAWTAALYTKSPAGYRLLRNTCALTLPGESPPRRMLKSYKSGPGLNESQLKLIDRLAVRHKESRDRVISLHLDEINVRPAYDYKAGKISGQAHNGDGPATEILGFMIFGLLSGLREMISLLPVWNVTAEEMYRELMSVMQALEERGFAVVVLVTDNHKKNQRLYNLLAFFSGVAKGEVQTSIARWIHLSYAHSLKQSRSLRVTKLTETTIAPNNLEKQNVNLALKVYCEKTARGVEILSKEFSENRAFRNVSGTVNLIDAFVRLWRMWDIRRPDQHKRYLLPDMRSFDTLDDERFNFMDALSAWLRAWQARCTGSKKAKELTIDTFKSLTRTLDGIQKLIKYLITDCGAKFVLTGKISNDVIEGRFRSYRDLSGSSYLVSVTEVMESQGRLQLSGYLRAHKVPFGSAKLEATLGLKTVTTFSESTMVQCFGATSIPRNISRKV